MENEIITKEHYKMAQKLAQKFENNYDDQQDLIQECLIKLFSRIKKKGFSPGLNYDWVVLYSGAMDWLRKKKQKKKLNVVGPPCENILDPISDKLIRDFEENFDLQLEYKTIFPDGEKIDLNLLKDFVDSNLDLESLAFKRKASYNSVTVNIHRKRKIWKERYNHAKEARNRTSNS